MIKELYESKLYKTDKFTGHQYMETYKKVLNPRKNTAKNILEIGVKAGGSVLLWRDFFTNAQIYGVDIDGMPEDLVNNNERITIIKDNAYDIQFIHNNFVSKGIKFDVLIDDGPHSLESMMFFCKALFCINGRWRGNGDRRYSRFKLDNSNYPKFTNAFTTKSTGGLLTIS